MRQIILLCTVVSMMLPAIASAKLYKCENAGGEVVYTDQPCLEGKGKELKLAPYSTYSPNIVPVPSVAAPAQQDPAASYRVFEILRPLDDKLITSATGRVNVSFKLDGPLLSVEGHKFAVALDGKKLKTRGVTNQIRLNNVDPGTHTLQVFVVDAQDKVIKRSNSIRFHMLRRTASSNNPTPSEPDLLKGIPGSSGTVPGGVGTVPGSATTIPGGRR